MKISLDFFFGPKTPKSSQEAEFDIEGLDVFSIERDDAGQTVFGIRWSVDRLMPDRLADGATVYLTKTLTEIEEWRITTTDTQHEAFVARLTAKIAARENKSSE